MGLILKNMLNGQLWFDFKTNVVFIIESDRVVL